MLKRSDSSGGSVNTVVGAGSTLEGTFRISNTIRVDGTLRGKLESTDTLIVGKTGVLQATVKVKSAIVGGKLIGRMEAIERVVLEPGCFVVGDVSTRWLVVEEGAVFNGKCTSGDGKVKVPDLDDGRLLTYTETESPAEKEKEKEAEATARQAVS